MASGESSIPRSPALNFPKESLQSKLERFPWWFVAMVSMALATIGVIFSQPSYYQAFVFIQAGIQMTITTTLLAFVVSLMLGLMAGLGRISRHVFFRNLSTLYVEIVRGIPMLVLIFFIAFVAVPAVTSALNALGNLLVDAGVPWAGWLTQIENQGVPMQIRAIIALSVTYGAFSAEVFRAGIQSIPKGQMEAARSQGMTYWQAMRFVILPQAIRNVLPALGNDFVSMLKDSSLVSVLAVRDITQVARLYAGQTFRYPEAFTTLAVLYLIMTLILSLGVKAIEKGLGYGQHR